MKRTRQLPLNIPAPRYANSSGSRNNSPPFLALRRKRNTLFATNLRLGWSLGSSATVAVRDFTHNRQRESISVRILALQLGHRYPHALAISLAHCSHRSPTYASMRHYLQALPKAPRTHSAKFSKLANRIDRVHQYPRPKLLL